VTQSATAFGRALEAVRGVEGWMTDAQARRLWDRAREVPTDGRIVEIGSYRGRSAIVLALGSTDGVEVVAIDPHAGNDRGPQEIHGTVDEGEGDHQAFLANLDRAGVRGRIRHVRRPSQEAGPDVEDPIDLLYIDGAHRFVPARADIREWGTRVGVDGTMLIHDAFSAVGLTNAMLTQLLFGGRFRYIGRSGSLAEYRRVKMTGGGRAMNVLRQLGQLPWFARNVVIKALIVLRLRPLTRLLGHRSGEWPY
jgi:methyltransferase family protein